MARKSKLLLALDAQKGRDYEAEKLKKQVKSAEKRKRQKLDTNNDDNEREPDHTTIQRPKVKKAKLDVDLSQRPSTSEEEDDSQNTGSDSEEQSKVGQNGSTIPQPVDAAEVSASEAEQDSDVPLSDLGAEDMEDIIPHQRLTINNGPALIASRKRVTISKPNMPFHYHNSLISSLPDLDTAVPDPNDDVTRELEFYRIARDAVVTARSNLKKEKVPFTRPSDYFAEMVKSDEHMGKIKKKLYDEAAGKKASEEARKLRDAKKFGKQVQMAKEQERAREKRATLDNIKELKKRRKGQPLTTTTEADDLFQEIAVDNNPTKRQRDPRGDKSGPNIKRQKRDSKFGFGGKKRYSKSGDAVSSADMSGFSARKMKGRATGAGGGGGGGARGGRKAAPKRLGKSKRLAARS